MTTPAISVHNLIRTFGHTRALDEFSMTVETGEVRGFLGPNGSGKSTTIRILLGMIRADSGDAQVLRLDPWKDSVTLHHRIAYVAGDTALWPNLTGGETIDMLTRHRTGMDVQKRKQELLERFELDPTKKTRTYSKGNRQKVALVAALCSDADVYFLDEPTSGLDPLMEVTFQNEVRRLAQSGKTILLSSHILGEVEKLCDTVTIIRAGKDVLSGPLSQLRHLTRSTVSATVPHDSDNLAQLDSVHDYVREGDQVTFHVDDRDIEAVLPRLLEMSVRNLTITPPSLEDMFLQHYGDELPVTKS